jgi:putative membrane protein
MTAGLVWGPGWGVLFGFAWLAFWVLVIAAVVALVRGRPTGPEGRSLHALTVLEERYARGEIDREDFLERRRVLRGEPPRNAG